MPVFACCTLRAFVAVMWASCCCFVVRHFGTLFLKRAVGGATRSALPGTTLDMMPFGLPKGFKLIDTPGVPSGNQARILI